MKNEMDYIDGNLSTSDSETPAVSGDVRELHTVPTMQASCPTCGGQSAMPSIDKDLGEHEQVAPQSRPSGQVGKLPLDIQKAVHACALEIIATESRCVEWGAPAQRSVELAEEAITNIVRLAVFSTQGGTAEGLDAA